MNKITIKHYLNNKLNSHTIKGNSYFCVYVQITAKRRTTKVKSKIVNELCTIDDFSRIKNEKSKLEIECNTIKVLVETQLNLFEEFDTNLFSALYNFMDKFNIEDGFFTDIDGKRITKIKTYYDVFNPNNQKETIKKDCYGLFDNIYKFNSAFLLKFFEVLNIISKTNKKYSIIGEKYKNECENPNKLLRESNIFYH